MDDRRREDQPDRDTESQAGTPTRAQPADRRLLHDWTQRARRSVEPPVLVHWVDEKGSIVRLITSAEPRTRDE